MNASSSTTPSPFMRLPTELKARIVEMVKWQDEAYEEELADLSDWYGKGLKALSETNRELNALAAVHMFETVDAHKTLDSSAFQFIVLARQLTQIKTIRFSGKVEDYTIAQQRQAVSLLLLLPNLRSLDIAFDFMEDVLAVPPFIDSSQIDEAVEDEEQQTRQNVLSALRTVVSRLAELKIECCSAASAVELIKWTSNLNSLSISLNRYNFDQKELELQTNLLRDPIQSLSSLRSLTIEAYHIGPHWLTASWNSSNTLLSLVLKIRHINQSLLDLLNHFPNLESLAIDAYSTEHTLSTAALLSNSSLSRLSHLSVEIALTPEPAMLALLNLFFATPAPSPLVDVKFNVRVFKPKYFVPYSAALKLIPSSVRRFEWDQLLRYASSQLVRRLQTIYKAPPRNILFVGLDDHLAALDRRAAGPNLAGGSDAQILLDWGKSKLDAMAVTGDKKGTQQVRQALTTLESMRDVERQ